ncbi:hypothetical protein ACLOJK_018294 [Asimina triloba]
MAKNHFHVRSTSMPSSPHPLALKVEEQLQTLRAWEADHHHQTPETLCRALNALSDLCHLVDALLQLPLAQQSLFHHRHHRCADEALDGCLRMLDICLLIRELLTEKKENAQDLQSALRRRERHGLRKKLRFYFSSKKKMKKAIEKSLRESKKTEKHQIQHCRVSPHVFVHVLREVRLVAISVLGSILSFVSSAPSRDKKTRSIASRCLFGRWMMGKQRVACQGREVKMMNEGERVDAAVFALLICGEKMIFRDENLGRVQNAQMQLEGWECSIESVKERLDCVFPCLIKMRVSLLNSFNH